MRELNLLLISNIHFFLGKVKRKLTYHTQSEICATVLLSLCFPFLLCWVHGSHILNYDTYSLI